MGNPIKIILYSIKEEFCSMAIKLAINGFGRIGRLTLRRIWEENESNVEIVAINDLTDNEFLAYLLKYDTAHGTFNHDIETTENGISIDGKEITVYSERDANDLPWGDLGVDIVLECTGFYATKEKSQAHINAGAKKVIISAPADAETKTIVYGVNEDIIEAEDKIISGASCTTNCLAPVVNVLEKEFGIKHGLMSTIHAYTSTQSLQDAPNGKKGNFRNGRAAAENAIPASTGAAKAVGRVIPSVNGKVDGTAIRIPIVTGSMTEFYSSLNTKVTVEEVNAAMEKYANPSFLYNTDDIVSSDIVGVPAGSIFDATQTKVIESEDGQLVKTVAWYDNEAGFVSQFVRLIEFFAAKQ